MAIRRLARSCWYRLLAPEIAVRGHQHVESFSLGRGQELAICERCPLPFESGFDGMWKLSFQRGWSALIEEHPHSGGCLCAFCGVLEHFSGLFMLDAGEPT
jgi:hypothetical protein